MKKKKNKPSLVRRLTEVKKPEVRPIDSRFELANATETKLRGH